MKLLRLLSILLLTCNFAIAQISQQTIVDEITANLPTNNRNEILAELLRNTLNQMTSAIFQSQGLSGLTITSTPTIGQALIATGSTTASWQSIGGLVTSVTNNDGSLIINPNTGNIIGSLNTNHLNTWTQIQNFNAGITGAINGVNINGIPLIGYTPVATSSTTAIWNSPSVPNNVLYAINFPGPTTGDQISQCVAALPSTGGTCDARGLPSGGIIPTITLGKSGTNLLGPCGVFNVTGSIIITAAGGISNFNWIGCGWSFNFAIGTQLFWVGNTTDPMIRLQGVRDSTFTDIGIKADLTNPLAEGIRLETLTGAISTDRTFRNIQIESVRAAGLLKGMRWCIGNDCGGTGTDANNDLDTLYNVSVSNYDNCAFSLEATQTKTITFINPKISGQAQSLRGVCTTQAAGTGLAGNVTILTNGTSGCSASGTYNVVGGVGTPATVSGLASGGKMTTLAVASPGTYSVLPPPTTTLSGTGCSVDPTIAFSTNSPRNAGSFRWYSGAGGSNAVADFDIGSPTDTSIVNGCNFENSGRLLQTGITSAFYTFDIAGCRWTSNAINQDGNVILYQQRGPINISGLQIETGGSTVPPTIRVVSSGVPAIGNASGNLIQSSGATAVTNPFTCGTSPCWNLRGNIVSDSVSGTEFLIPNADATQVIFNSAVPTIASGACGTGANGAIVAGSTNQSGSITIGSSSTTACAISWSATLAAAPKACIFFPANAAAAATGTTVASVGAPSTIGVTLNGSALANANYQYFCM